MKAAQAARAPHTAHCARSNSFGVCGVGVTGSASSCLDWECDWVGPCGAQWTMVWSALLVATVLLLGCQVRESAREALRFLCQKRLVEWRSVDNIDMYLSTPLGEAAFGSSLTPEECLRVHEELLRARSEGLVLSTDLHLVYLVSPLRLLHSVLWTQPVQQESRASSFHCRSRKEGTGHGLTLRASVFLFAFAFY